MRREETEKKDMQKVFNGEYKVVIDPENTRLKKARLDSVICFLMPDADLGNSRICHEFLLVP